MYNNYYYTTKDLDLYTMESLIYFILVRVSFGKYRQVVGQALTAIIIKFEKPCVQKTLCPATYKIFRGVWKHAA